MLLVTIKYQTKVIQKWTGGEPSNRESMNIYVQSKKKKHLLSWHFVAPPMHACNSRAKIGWCFGNEANAMQVNQSTRRRKTWNWYTEHWKLIILGRNHGLIAWEKIQVCLYIRSVHSGGQKWTAKKFQFFGKSYGLPKRG